MVKNLEEYTNMTDIYCTTALAVHVHSIAWGKHDLCKMF